MLSNKTLLTILLRFKTCLYILRFLSVQVIFLTSVSKILIVLHENRVLIYLSSHVVVCFKSLSGSV